MSRRILFVMVSYFVTSQHTKSFTHFKGGRLFIKTPPPFFFFTFFKECSRQCQFTL